MKVAINPKQGEALGGATLEEQKGAFRFRERNCELESKIPGKSVFKKEGVIKSVRLCRDVRFRERHLN